MRTPAQEVQRSTPGESVGFGPSFSAEGTKSSVPHLLNGFDDLERHMLYRPNPVALRLPLRVSIQNLPSFTNDRAFSWHLPATQLHIVGSVTPMPAAIFRGNSWLLPSSSSHAY